MKKMKSSTGRVIHPKDGGYGFIKYVQPHNYRRYYGWEWLGFKEASARGYGYWINGKSEFLGRLDYFTFRCKKRTVEVFVNKYDKQWVRVEASRVRVEIRRIMEELDQECVIGLRRWIALVGGNSDFLIRGERHPEFGVKGDEILDKIPRGMIIDSTSFKKVYEEKVEFKSGEGLVNYVENRSVESNAGRLVELFGELKERVWMPLEEAQGLITRFDNPEALLVDFRGVVMRVHPAERGLLFKWWQEKRGA